MSFFKILSDNPADFESETPDLNDPNLQSFYMQKSSEENCIELILDTGEEFCIPLDWLIRAARVNDFGILVQSGWLH